jgi:peroxiredoxin
MDFDVVALEDTDHPTEGDTAPDFTRPLVTDEYWEDVSLSELTDDGPVLLAFHPMDGGFPATYLWDELSDRILDIEDLTVAGLSISSPYEHKSFLAENDLERTGAVLFSDPANDVAQQYDIVHDLDGMAGVSEPRPAVFLVDEQRTISFTWVADEWPDFPEYDDLENAIDTVL